MQTILRILKQAGGWHHGLYLKIENPPYMALVIELPTSQGPCGLPAISVCHYGEQNGDLMRDPEMCFELGFAEGRTLESLLLPERLSRHRAVVTLHPRWKLRVPHRACTNEHERFAKLWDNNLRLQGFAEAFERQQQTPRA